MLNLYQEFKLLPQEEISIHFLWSKVFQQIHLGLVESSDQDKKSKIGASFPEYKMGEKFGGLGTKLRLFAPDADLLNRFDAQKWLERLLDYVHITRIREVPQQVSQYVIFNREQAKSSVARVARRKAKYEKITEAEALQSLENFEEQRIPLPYIHMQSLTSQHHFPLFVAKRIAEKSQVGFFNTYGLSSATTVPDF